MVAGNCATRIYGEPHRIEYLSEARGASMELADADGQAVAFLAADSRNCVLSPRFLNLGAPINVHR